MDSGRMMESINLSQTIDNNFIKQVKEESGQDPDRCYQCGNCTAGCPYTQFFDYPVSMVMRLIQAGQRETVLNSKAIWLCATCETCTTRCPCEIDVAQVMDTLADHRPQGRAITRRRTLRPSTTPFSRLSSNHGRIYEVGILMGYNVKSGHLLADADLGPKVISHGQLHFLPKNIKGKDQVARIFKKFTEKKGTWLRKRMPTIRAVRWRARPYDESVKARAESPGRELRRAR